MGLLVLAVGPARGALQFDVFLGYDGIVREGAWFPVACEIYNDGPSFNGVFELTQAQLGRSQARRMAIELPNGTRKRFTIPVFASMGRFSSWDARLYDDRGKVRAERTAIRVKDLVWEGTLVGALPRTFGGVPVLPDIRQQGRGDMRPQVARMQAEVFPDNPISLEGLTALYLNTEKALDLKAPQTAAILTWLHGGGHLFVGVEQPGDLGGLGWLRPLMPVDLRSMTNLPINAAFLEWLKEPPAEAKNALQGMRSTPVPRPGRAPLSSEVSGANPYQGLVADEAFDGAELPVAVGTVKDGQVMFSLGGTPLIVSARRGRGELTVLCFSPEREPFRSWKHRGWFWARLAQVPTALFTSNDFNLYGGWSVDGIFGAMIDSRQVRKLPVEWLISLLVVYLLVIGPLDQWWLKKINRQMLTWVTFPSYVVIFSLLIYFIGYKLRAGETEWNELHVVDVVRNGDRAELRGRSYLSMYSPVNATYPLASDQKVATLRGEFQGLWGGGQDSARASVEQRQAGFRADVYVPVWTSQLFVSDWWQSDRMPLSAQLAPQGPNWLLTLENRLDRPLKSLRLVLRDRVYECDEVGPGKTLTMILDDSKSTGLADFVTQHSNEYQQKVQERQRALGEASRGWLEGDLAVHAGTVSFLSEMRRGNSNQRQFIYPPGLDLGDLVERGDAVLLAWAEGYAPTKPMRQFQTLRGGQRTLFRLVMPVDPLPML